MARKKLALIGAGQIGGTMAFLSAIKELADVVLLDIVEGMAKGKALDIKETTPILGTDIDLMGTSDYKDIEGADVVIVTAGLPRKPGMSREDLLEVNTKIMLDVSYHIGKYAPNAFVIVISNPLDAMVWLMKYMTGFPKNMVIGQAGILDTSRFRAFVAMELGVSVREVQALVMGSHGDDMVAVLSQTKVGGVPIKKLIPADRLQAIVQRTQKGGGEIVKLLEKGSAFYAPASAAIEMAEAYLKDEKRILSCHAYLEGEYGINGYFVGVPVKIGAGGVEEVLIAEMDDDEKKAFEKSANHIQEVVEGLKNLLDKFANADSLPDGISEEVWEALKKKVKG